MRFLLCGLLLFSVTVPATGQEPPKPKKIVLIAGKKSHGPGVHEYEKSVRLLKAMLDTSPNLEGYHVEIHFNGWPTDPTTLDDADTIMTISDGRDGNKFSPVPWMTEQRMAVMRKQMQRGCGFITFHFSTFASDMWGKDVLEWGGGYFDWEDENGERNWYSAITTLKSKVELGTPEHPISHGLKPLDLREEFYYKIRFRENDPRLKPIWRVPELGENLENVVAWAVEREDGGRGFSTTCGHFYDNWEEPQFRKLILNAIVWTAGGEVPAEGVESEFYPDEEVSRILAGPPVEALIVTGHQYPGHLWKDTTPAIREALGRDIRMNVSVVEDVEFLAKPKLHEYDMLVLNYCNWMKPGLSEAAKENFVKYLKEGGGLTIVHFTNGAFHFSLPEAGDSDWPEWRTNICRRVWDHTPGKSGHDKYGPFIVEIAKPEHPIVAGMEPFETTDELYFRQQGDQPIEVLATARSEITGEHAPMAFIYEYGKGRVFQTVLGHSADSLRVEGTAELVCRGSLWAAGRDPHLIPNPNRPVSQVDPLIPGRYGKALDGTNASAEVAHRDEYQTWPLTVECRAKVDSKQGFQLLVAKNLKSSGKHWEIYTYAGSGEFSAYLPGYQPAENRSGKSISDGMWHDLAMTFDGTDLELFVDGASVLQRQLKAVKTDGADGPMWFGSYPPNQLGLKGAIDEVRISQGIRTIGSNSNQAWAADEQTIALWAFDELVEGGRFADRSKLNSPATLSGSAGKSIPKVSAFPPGAIKDIVEGHWGHDVVGFGWREKDSVDGRLNQMQTGPFFSGTIATPGTATMKGLCIKLGDNEQAGICYDTELLRVSAGWLGGFLEHDSRRYGLIRPANLKGEVLFQSPPAPGWSVDDTFPDPRPDKPWGPLPREQARYEGLFRFGNRVVLKYTVGDSEVLESPWAVEREKKMIVTRTLSISPSKETWNLLLGNEQTHATVTETGGVHVERKSGRVWAIIPPHEDTLLLNIALADASVTDATLAIVASEMVESRFEKWTSGGPRLWTQEIITRGERSQDDQTYVIDTITLPFENPYKALFFASGHDFFSNGDAALSTVHGDVWRVSGIDDDLDRIEWTRYATGLFQPLGVKIVDDVVHVVGRDQITRLHDLNRDGEADWYENFNNEGHVTPNPHEYVTSLETDSKGNFYFLKGNSNSESKHDGSVLRVSADGSKLEVFATGFRNANGMSIGPHDEITVAPQEGEWTPGSAVFDVHQGGFYGAMMSHHRPQDPTTFEQPICWLPRIEDNSSGGQAWVTSDRWGPLEGQLLHLSYGTCRMFLVLREHVDGQIQGGTVSFPLTFESGAMRGRFSPHDGQLYVSGLHGWVSNSAQDGCFQRVRYTGQAVNYPVKVKTFQNGIALTFSQPLDRDSVEDVSNYVLSQWNFKWSAEYGSEPWKVSQPNEIGREPVILTSATLLDDNKTVFLTIPDLQPVNIFKIDYDIHSADFSPIQQTYHHTINRVPENSFSDPALARTSKQLATTERPQGLLLELNQSEQRVSRRERLPALFQDVGESIDARLSVDAPFGATWTGWLNSPTSDDYQFQIESSSPVELTLDNRPFSLGENDWSEPIFLKRGEHAIQIRLSKATERPLFLRTLWKSDKFPAEPIPPEMFTYESTEMLSESSTALAGRFLFEDRNCASCHRDVLIDQTALKGRGPKLDRLSRRVDPRWVKQWLLDPTTMRTHTTMPALFGDTPQDRQAVADLIALLCPPETYDPPVLIGDVDLGQKLWETLGCIGCHSFESPAAEDEFDRVSLHLSTAKYRPGQISQQIRNPHTLMPSFRLNDEEYFALEAFVRTKSKGELTMIDLPVGDATRGRDLFLKRGCVNCHSSIPTAEGGVEHLPEFVPPSFKLVKVEAGCLSVQVTSNAPRHNLSADERTKLIAFLKQRSRFPTRPSATERFENLWTKLRCATCHSRDGEKSSLPLIIAEDGDIGKIPVGLPDLTWAGEKLDPAWMAHFLGFYDGPKPRTWLTTQMPSFPSWADELSRGLAAQHGYGPEKLIEPYRPDQVALGELLIGKTGGLDCRQCHAVGNRPATGDKQTQLALGINFRIINDRVRKSYYDRFVLDPPRYAPGTRMPKLSADGKKTGVRRIYDGDAHQQFDALWHFIQQVK